jgi:hypothetical protein
MKKLFITADFNDGDYGNGLVVIDEETFNKFLPLIKAINAFEPYVRHSEYGGVDYHNWEGLQTDLGELSVEEKYPNISEELIEEFRDVFMSEIPTGIYCCEPHTIVSLIDVLTDEVYIDTKGIFQRTNEKIENYRKEEKEIYSYRRPSDGTPLNSIPFSQMSSEEKALIERLDNLWKKYV